MSRFSKDKSASKSVRKYLRKRVDAAREVLRHTRLSDEHVHEARKELKKARATLRLLRPALKNRTYQLENAAMRDAAKPLSAVRDAKVLLDTLHGLGKFYGEPVRVLRLDGFKRVLKRRRAQARRETLGAKSAALPRSRRLLDQSSRRIADLNMRNDDDWGLVGAGLKRVYVRGQRALAGARQRPAADAFHEWRKQVKYLRYALELFEPLWPGVIGELARETHQLADDLGDEHDLTVLRETALAEQHSFGSERTLTALLALIDERQAELRMETLSRGVRLYQEKPKAFTTRFSQYWRAWRDDASNEPSVVQLPRRIEGGRAPTRPTAS
jgi:CHAD domain-containing protein